MRLQSSVPVALCAMVIMGKKKPRSGAALSRASGSTFEVENEGGDSEEYGHMQNPLQATSAASQPPTVDTGQSEGPVGDTREVEASAEDPPAIRCCNPFRRGSVKGQLNEEEVRRLARVTYLTFEEIQNIDQVRK